MAKKTTDSPKIDVAVVLAECAMAVGRGLERASPTIQVGPAAGAFWMARYRKSIKKALENKVEWSGAQRQTALKLADSMGFDAASRADGDKVTEISKAHAEASSKKIEQDRRCRPPRRAGDGRFCEI